MSSRTGPASSPRHSRESTWRTSSPTLVPESVLLQLVVVRMRLEWLFIDPPSIRQAGDWKHASKVSDSEDSKKKEKVYRGRRFYMANLDFHCRQLILEQKYTTTEKLHILIQFQALFFFLSYDIDKLIILLPRVVWWLIFRLSSE